SVARVTERTVALLQPVADAAGVTVEKNLKPGCAVLCTEDDLSQICYNLVENAVKYNYNGGKVFVSVYRDGDQVLLEVGDTGVG
ncbi:two-component sensor histidine kinase, partial [Klebsiella oxytoca]